MYTNTSLYFGGVLSSNNILIHKICESLIFLFSVLENYVLDRNSILYNIISYLSDEKYPFFYSSQILLCHFSIFSITFDNTVL